MYHKFLIFVFQDLFEIGENFKFFLWRVEFKQVFNELEAQDKIAFINLIYFTS